jgi:(R)-citramalyl-CoA lyase
VIVLCDVGPRDGLQNEPDVLDPATRAELVNRLAGTGLRRIEAVSFVRTDRVPQMADAEEVVARIDRREGVEFAGLVLNEEGHDRLRQTALDRINCTLAATEEFSRRNANATVAEATDRMERILSTADRPTTVTISVAFGCPFEGRVEPDAVVALAERLAQQTNEIVLADTIGVATPRQVRELTKRVAQLGKPVGGHFHDTRHTGVANALAALDAGASVLDASVGGLGGCPFAPRATGNVATEDLVYALEGDGIATGVDLDELVRTAEWTAGVLGRPLPGRVYRAGPFPSGA